MQHVIFEFNTDENNKWVYEDRMLQGDPLPMCIYGPFEDPADAEHFLECFMADDTDVNDAFILTGPPEPYWTINDPKDYPCCEERSAA